MATASFTSNFLVTHINGGTMANVIRQGYYAPDDTGGSADNARNCGQWGFDYSAINTTLSGGKIADSATLTMTSTSWGLSSAYSLHIYKSPFAANPSVGSKLDPVDYYPAGDIYSLYPDYIESPEFLRSETKTFSIPLDYLTHIRNGKLLACYRRTYIATPTASHYTREFTSAPVLTITYHSPASTFTLNKTTVDAGQTITATVNPADNSYSHRVTWKINNTYAQTNTISAGSTTNTFTIPFGNGSPVTNNWCTAITNGTSITCTCLVETLSGSTVLGSGSKTFTMTVPSSVKPSIESLSSSVVDGYEGLYLQNRSKVTLTANNPLGIYGSTITSYSIGGGSTNPYTTRVLSTTGTNTFNATVTDTRGRISDTKSVSITVTPYSFPRITSFVVERASDSSGTLSDEGKYAKCSISYTWTNLSSNTNSTTISYRELGSSGAYTAGTYSITSGGFVVLGSGTTFETTKLYEFKVEFSDGTGASDISGVIMYKAETFFDWHPGIDSACFGGFATYANTFEVAPTRYLRAYGQTIGVPSNPNLLIGGNFSTNPWQMGSGPFTSIGYGADKWRQNATDMTVSKNGDNLRVVNSNATTRRILHNFTEVGIVTGNTYTLSICTAAGAIYSGYVVANTTTRQDVNFTGGHSISLEYFSGLGMYAFCIVVAANTTLDVAWCKAEIGTVYTPEIPRPKQQELAMCQRELYILGGGAYEKFCIGMYSTATQASIVIKPPVRMRVAPTPVLTGNFSLSGTVLAGGTFSNDGSTADTICIKNTSVSGKTPGYSFLMYANNDTSARIVNDAQIYP